MVMAWGHLCLACPTGHFSTQRSQACLSCPSGHFQPQQASTSCRECPGGYAQKRRAAKHQCDRCPPGTVSGIGNALCQTCAKGKTIHAAEPLLTLDEVFSFLHKKSTTAAVRASRCVDCLEGRFGSSRGRCNACPSGKYSSKIGEHHCKQCPVGQQSQGGSSTCRDCPSGELCNPILLPLYRLLPSSQGSLSHRAAGCARLVHLPSSRCLLGKLVAAPAGPACPV